MGLSDRISRLARRDAESRRAFIGLIAGLLFTVLMLWSATTAVMHFGLDQHIPAFVTETYKNLLKRFLPDVPPQAPPLMVALLAVAVLLSRPSWRKRVGLFAFPLVLGALEHLVDLGEFCERRRGVAEGLLITAVVIFLGSGATILTYRNASDAQSAAFAAWLDGAESFVRTTSLSSGDASSYFSLPDYNSAFDRLTPHSRSLPSAPKRLDSLLRIVFADTAARVGEHRFERAYAAVNSLADGALSDTALYHAHPAAQRAWGLLLLLRARMALDILESCSINCPTATHILSDLAAVQRDTLLVREATNARGRTLSWAVSRALGQGNAPQDSVVERCSTNLWSCVDEVMRAYAAPIRGAKFCSVAHIRSLNNQLDALTRIASAHPRIVSRPAFAQTVPLWVRDRAQLADTLQARSRGVMSCLPGEGRLPPPVYLTVAEAAGARFGLLYARRVGPAEEIASLGSLIRLAVSMEVNAPRRLRAAAMCVVQRSPSEGRVWAAASSSLIPLPHSDIAGIRRRVRQACRS